MMVLPGNIAPLGEESSSRRNSSSSVHPDDSSEHSETLDNETGHGQATMSDGATKEGKKGASHEARWEEMFKRLVKYRAENGDCLVPNRYTDDPKLGTWVATQRRQYKVLMSRCSNSTPMTPERAMRLQQIGFEWSPKDPRSVPWEARFKELIEFIGKHGHAQVPMRLEENVPLSNWVSTQRQEYKLLQKGSPSRLTSERVRLLNEVGFVWEAKRGCPGWRKKESRTSVPLPHEEASVSGEISIERKRNMEVAKLDNSASVSDTSPLLGNSMRWNNQDVAAAAGRELELIRNALSRQHGHDRDTIAGLANASSLAATGSLSGTVLPSSDLLLQSRGNSNHLRQLALQSRSTLPFPVNFAQPNLSVLPNAPSAGLHNHQLRLPVDLSSSALPSMRRGLASPRTLASFGSNSLEYSLNPERISLPGQSGAADGFRIADFLRNKQYSNSFDDRKPDSKESSTNDRKQKNAFPETSEAEQQQKKKRQKFLYE